MRRYMPLRRVLGTVKEPLAGTPERGLYAALDALECGHHVGAVFLAPRSKAPYVRTADGTYRKCAKCPRVAW